MNMIRLWAVALCVSLGLLAMPVAVADTSSKAALSATEQAKAKDDLFAAWNRIIKSEATKQRTKDMFQNLAPSYQQKTLQFYNAGVNKQVDELKLVKGVRLFMGLLENIEVAKRAINEYQRTKQMPSRDPLNFDPMLERLTSDYPWFAELIDVQTVKKLDASVITVYVAIGENLEKEIAQGEAKIAQGEAKIAQGEAKIAQGEAKIARLDKEIKVLKALLNAL
jgi:hypothetical protein